MLMSTPIEPNTNSGAASGSFPTATLDESAEARAARMARAKSYFLFLARRAETNPQDAEVLSGMLADRVTEYWEPAFDAAMEAAEELEYAQVHPLIDAVIARSLREKPDLNLVAELYNKIPLETVLLKQTGLEVFRQTVKAMEDRNRVELHPAGYLAMLLNLVARLHQLEQWQEAEGLAKKALDFSKAKYAEDPKTFFDAFTSSLETMAIGLAANGENEKCREVRGEAIQLLRGVPGHERNLAQSLNNHAGVLKALGDDSGALAHSLEAVRVYRELVDKGPPEGGADYSKGLDAWVKDCRPNLAKALVGLSSYQDRAKLQQDCLASASEAFDIFFTLSEDYPDQFRDAFGLARHNLGMAKFGVGDREGGLREFQAAADLFEKLAEINFEVYGPTYAHMLDSLMRGYVKNNRNEEALAQVEKCLHVYRSLNERTSGRYVGKVREWQEILKGFYEDLGRPEKAKAVAEEIAREGTTTNQG